MKSVLACVLCLVGTFGVRAAAPRGLGTKGAEELPLSAQGRFPVAIPTYKGQVKQLLVLSDRWLVVVVYDVPEVVKRMDELSGGRLVKAVHDFRESERAGRPDWKAFHLPKKIYKQYLAQAREDLGERKLDLADSFRIASKNDSNFGRSSRPKRVTRTLISLGGTRVDGGHSIDYAHYCYIELPKPLKNGGIYRVTVADRGSVTLTWDERRMVSRSIKVNQAGYLPNAGTKLAYLGAWACEFGPVDFSAVKQFEVINVATGGSALKGKVKLIEKNPRFGRRSNDKPGAVRPEMFGEDVYALDLSGLKEEGNFFIAIPGVGRSWTFRHAQDAYGEPFYIACRGLFHQRAASPLKAKYTAWTREKSKMHDTIYESEDVKFPQHQKAPKGYNHFDTIGGTQDRNRVTKNVIGGWYDAADWDRNIFHYVCAFDLLNAYEWFPKRFSDRQLNLPESGNGIPDILDEARWGLECWRRSQRADGGVSGYIETSTHPTFNDPRFAYSFSQRTRWSSLIYAAAAAQFARLIKPYDATAYKLYSASALRAWEFGIEPKNALRNITINAKRNRGKGAAYSIKWNENDDATVPYRVHAALQMARLTGDGGFLTNIGTLASKAKKPFDWPFSHKGISAWLYSELAFNTDKKLPADLVATWRAFYIKTADELLKHIKNMPYRQTWPRHQNFWAGWGAICVTNFNRCLGIAWRLTGDRKYRDAIVINADAMLGANAKGMSWTTGIGYVYPIDFQHEHSMLDGVPDPVPGITVYGLNGGPGMHHTGRAFIWNSPGPDGKPVSFIKQSNTKTPFFRSWSCHPMLNTGQCEFTIHETMASTIFTCALLLDNDWKPSAVLKKRGPRKKELLFGLWYLP